MSLYETIFARRSVRSFDMAPLDEETLGAIKKFLDGIDCLSGQTFSCEIAGESAVGAGKAPHYILAYSDGSTAADINVGYALAKADLFIQSIGLGSLYLGMAKPKDKKKGFALMLAFGKSDVPARKGEADFKRLDMKEVSSESSAVAKAARLAPSAMNNQPWFVRYETKKVTVDYKGRGPMKLILKPKLSKVDIGIEARFVQVALENFGTEIESVTAYAKDGGYCVEILQGNDVGTKYRQQVENLEVPK